MLSLTSLWAELGGLPEEECLHLLSRLFNAYEQALARDPDDPGALDFFRRLEQALDQTAQCNLNRR